MLEFKDFIQETYFDTLDIGGALEVFMNPTPDEMRDIPSMPYARGFLDSRGNVYFWDVEVFHDEIKRKMRGNWVAHLEIDVSGKELWVMGLTPSVPKVINRSQWLQKNVESKNFAVHLTYT